MAVREVVICLTFSLLTQFVQSYTPKHLINEFYITDDLGSCRNLGGKCQNDTKQCIGSYITATCTGGATQKCCLPRIQVQDTGDCQGLPILSRDTWGAARPKLIENLTLPMTMFFIHHTDTETDQCHDTESCSSVMRAIQRFHMVTRGWEDIAYSFLIGGDGQVYEGRGWDRVGAHTYRYNYVSLAAAFIGTFNDTMPPTPAVASVRKLLMCGVNRNAITSTYSLYGHRDVRATTCPGYTLYNAIRKWPHYNVTTDRDGPCLQKGGVCGPTYLTCQGTFHKGLCNGYSGRQCCIPNQHARISELPTILKQSAPVRKLPAIPYQLAPISKLPAFFKSPRIKKIIKYGGFNCFGDFMLLRPSGRKSGGVQESRRELDAHYSLANKYHGCFAQVGNEVCLHPAVIAGVASRESNFGFSLTPDGWGDNHNAYGIMQCDVRKCPVCRFGVKCTTYRFDSCDHIRMMTTYVLVPNIMAVKSKFPNWLPQQHIQGGVAAYNFGVSNVRSWENLDVGTTGGDYSNDVIARAQWLVSAHGW
ncbi:uncharacterized protein LOC133185612 [Saccostrea echinata]|uniref:uncharacterized protein LOC133185612 n=1 Tax=Saccostrea echinata TaxID=191078 RepID=UPI002A815D6B|nr:uncharacterized protein LOC133185612 [Saccostrea echinata]